MNLNYRNDSQLYKELFGNTNDSHFDSNLYTHNYNNNHEISSIDKALCLQICSAISDHALFYYNHIDLSNFVTITKRQNYRILKIVNWYLQAPTFRKYLEEEYLDKLSGLYTLKYFKEFFNISQKNPTNNEEKLVASNKIIDGKINGNTVVMSPTVRTSDIFYKK